MKKITRRTFMKVMGTTAAAVGLSACGSSAGSTAASASNAASSTAVSAPAAAEALTFKVAYSESEDSIYGEVINAAFDEITSKTEGRVAFDVYPNNALGSITDMLEQMRAGAPMICSMGFDNLGDVVSDFAPASFPYVFNSLWQSLTGSPVLRANWSSRTSSRCATVPSATAISSAPSRSKRQPTVPATSCAWAPPLQRRALSPS